LKQLTDQREHNNTKTQTQRKTNALSYRFLCQNQVLTVYMTQDQLFHIYDPKVFTDNQMSQIKYNYYISNVSKDYDDSKRNRTAEDSITQQKRQPGQHVT
jgi:hypothetical protein